MNKSDNEIVALICARGGSKGLLNKNIKAFAGKPLIAWAIEHAFAVPRINRIIVSTDSGAIAEVAQEYGAEVPFIRPKELARDDSPEWLVWRHALGFLRDLDPTQPDVMVSVPCTAPLRLPVDIENCLDEYAKGDADIIITVTDAHRSPYFNMVKKEPNDTVNLVIPPEGRICRRQDVPIVYDVTTVAYIARPEFVMNHDSFFQGRVKAVYVPKERAMDIDTPLDFEIAEFLMHKRQEYRANN